MNDVLKRIEQYKVVPVVVLENADHAAPLAKALTGGGLPCAEVTFRTAAAEASIRLMKQTCPEMLVGAGNRHQHGTGGAGAPRGSGIYREPGV